jgi:hypothetical protein
MATNKIGFQQGATFELNATVTYPDDIPGEGILAGDPVDITNWTITAQAFPPRVSATRPVITFVVTINDAPNGAYTIDQPDIPTNQWLLNTKYNLKITQTKANGFIYNTPTIVIDCREFL